MARAAGLFGNLDSLSRATKKDLIGAVLAFEAIVLASQSNDPGSPLDGHEIVFAFQEQFLEITAQAQTAVVATGHQLSTRVDLEVLHLALALEGLYPGGAAASE